jgi:hypothetical protein
MLFSLTRYVSTRPHGITSQQIYLAGNADLKLQYIYWEPWGYLSCRVLMLYCEKNGSTSTDASVINQGMNISKHFKYYYFSAVSIVTGYGLDGWGERDWIPVRARFFSSSHHLDQFQGPPSLLSNGYWGLFPWGKADEAWSWPFAPI